MEKTAFICIESSTGYKGIHCATDGGLDGVLKTLLVDFDRAKTEALISMGNVYRLRGNFGEKHSFENPYKVGTAEFDAENDRRESMCTFFHRDRGDKLEIYIEQSGLALLKAHEHIDYVYILGKDGRWTTLS